jgi:hypothetical protein
MPRGTHSRLGYLVAASVTALLVLASPASAGRLVATGHDADLHCSGASAQCHYLKAVVSYVRAGAPSPGKPVLVLDKGANEVSTALDKAFSPGVPPRVVMDPSSPSFASAPLNTSTYSAIIVASDSTCGGCDLNPGGSPADSAAIAARKGAIASFFNAGGGIVALAGASHGGAAGPDNSYYQFVPLPLGGAPVNAPFSLTPVGTSLGLVDNPIASMSDINCCPTHNSFSLPPADSALQVAEKDSKGLAETLVAEGTISGGGITKKKPGIGSVVGLPSTKKCVSKRKFRIHIRRPKGITIQTALVFVNGKRVKVFKALFFRRLRHTSGVNLRGLPLGTFKVKIVVLTTQGNTLRGTRTYHTCTKKRKHKKPPKL